MDKKSIGIIGGGFVGNAIKRYYDKGKYPVKVYDKYKESDSVEDVIKQDYIFIAVPTPYTNDKIDLEPMYDAMKNASRAKKGAIVIIKSTIIPGTTEQYQEKYPDLKIIFNPEFLTESTADQDFQFPDTQIIGHSKTSFDVAGEVLEILPLAPFNRIIPATEAEVVKYFRNIWYATKVIFANQIYDLCQKIGVDYDLVRESAGADRRMTGQSHLDVSYGGYRGYGGKCLPKDLRAFVSFADSKGVDLEFFKKAEEINRKLTKGEDKIL